MSKRRTIKSVCIVTGTRAEYGLLRPLLAAVAKDRGLELQLVVAGMHLSAEFGMTVNEIEGDGWPIAAKVENQLSSDSRGAMVKSTALALLGFAETFERLRPDVVVVLGDRYEIFAAAQAAYMLRIRVAHLHGGEVTAGALDEAFRHGITKMAHVHFASTAEHAARVVRMGEDPNTVHDVGALAVDSLSTLRLLSRSTLEREIGADLATTNFLVTYHPATLSSVSPERAVKALLTALDQVLSDPKDTKVFFTLANADAGGRLVNQRVGEFVTRHANRAHAYASLGQLRYLSLMKQASVVLGNSSSGIYEAPYFSVPTVNVGDRQAGRVHAPSVIDCPDGDSEAIADAIRHALSSTMRNQLARSNTQPFGNGTTAKKITAILRRTPAGEAPAKKFYDGTRS